MKLKDLPISKETVFATVVAIFVIGGVLFEPEKSKGNNPETPYTNIASLGAISQGYKSNHSGIDIAAKSGTAIRAFVGGKVVRVGNEDLYCKGKGYGKFIMIEEESGTYTLMYAHLRNQLFKKGDEVEAGDKIGEVGMTGLTTGPHLHLTIFKTSTLETEDHACGERLTGETINPKEYLTS